MSLKSFKDLLVWQKSIALSKEIYRITEHFPKSEIYGLSSQMRRASVSIPSNIAEGYKRKNTAEYLQFLSIANGSAAELETQITIARDLYKNEAFGDAEGKLEEIQKMLAAMIRKIKLRC
ncbi:MAG: four helix bundle protein [Candidatus Paceibacterota bacterium]|jgi:four helix bundle protein